MISGSDNAPWKILVVDDEEGIHGITRMIFRGYQFENRPIELISAYSGQEARDLLRNTDDIALVLLDVVMESDDEGLKLIDFIRNTLGNQDIRIILRTGHPGYAPETEVIVDYDINDYLSKAELSASRLLTSVVVALRSYRDIESARHNQKDPSDNQPFDARVFNQLGRNLKPLAAESLKQSARLQQMGLSPMAQELVQALSSHQQRLLNRCLLLEENFQPLKQLQVTDVRILLDQVVQALLPQARHQGWLLDYQIFDNLPDKLRLPGQGVMHLWLALTEHALAYADGVDLQLQLIYDAPQKQLELIVSRLGSAMAAFDISTPSQHTMEEELLNLHYQQIDKLCQLLGGTLIGSEQGTADQLLSCRLPVEEI
ncbi:MAG: response regulator [Motiliproteus sp.]|nr:response regulator [Motiliproteus sp.]MCW9053874.1 response regulator [Motiliproteus sp.]